MGTLSTINFLEAEWTHIAAGGILALFNGKARPYKYEPESQTIKRLGMILPAQEVTLAAVAAESGSTGLTGTYVYTAIEVDSKATLGEGQPSGPPRDSEGASVTADGEAVQVTLPLSAMNPNADEMWIYRSAAAGAWPVLGRIAKVDIGTATYTDNGDTPDFLNYPLDSTRDMPPSFHYPFKLKRRLLGWGHEELSCRLLFAAASTTVQYVSGEALDHGCIGMVIYPDGDTRGYIITDYKPGSPEELVIQDAFEGTTTSPDSFEQDCRLCRPSGQLRWSEPDDYEDFPAANVRYVEKAASDPETGAASINGRGLLFTAAKTFGLSFDTTPAIIDGQTAELSTGIGCLSHRTIQDIGGMLLWLSDSGIAVSNGGPPQIISDDIYPVFEEVIRDETGRATRAFAVNWKQKQRYICWVPQAADATGCSRAIVVDYKQLPGEPRFRFSIYEFDTEIVSASMERHVVTSTEGTNYFDYPILGDAYGYAWSLGIGDADGPESGTVSGTIDSVTTSPSTLTDDDAAFETEGLGLAGMPVRIRRDSDGEQQVQIVSTTAANTLSFRNEWEWTPVAGDTYQIGAIPSFYETPWSHFGGEERPKKLHGLVTTFEPKSTGSLTAKVYLDQSGTEKSLTNEGTSLDMTEATGRIRRKLSGATCHYGKVRWENQAPNEPWKLRHATLVLEYDEPS